MASVERGREHRTGLLTLLECKGGVVKQEPGGRKRRGVTLMVI